MSKKTLALGMIVPLAAAGAVATAPAASAASAPSDHGRHDGYRHSRASLDLDATPLRHGDWIKVQVRLNTRDRDDHGYGDDEHGYGKYDKGDKGYGKYGYGYGRDRGKWIVVIRKNGHVIEREQTRHGRLNVVEFTYDGRGTDHFSATAYNTRTGQRLYDHDVVYKWEPYSR